MTFYDQIRYNITFHQVQKGGESSINHIKIFHDAKASTISVGNNYTEYHLMNTFLDNLN